MQKLEMLQLLSDKVKNCTKCPTLVENRTQTVLDSGNPHAKLLILAESPGRDEDEKGEVLVGQAGQLLTNILAACGLKRPDDVYLCNVIKCRPPHNRNPTETECSNCLPYLDLQLKIVNPKFILCLGNIAAQNLLKTKDNISEIRGRWFSYKNGGVDAQVICSYHPSYLLRNQEKKKDAWQDMQILMEKLNAQ